MIDYSVLNEVGDERFRQDEKWGVQNHIQIAWLAILAEEFGEAAKEVNELHFRPGTETHHSTAVYEAQKARLREELIQVAAVAVAMIESLDRTGR